MKIIDLYELIANKEYDKLPRKIKIRGCIYDLKIDEEFINYKPKNGDWLLNQFLWKLNNEVEILEEKKKIPEKLNVEQDGEGKIDGIYMARQEIEERETINSIIDYLKSKGE